MRSVLHSGTATVARGYRQMHEGFNGAVIYQSDSSDNAVVGREADESNLGNSLYWAWRTKPGS